MQAGGIERSVTRIIQGLDRDTFLPIVICLDRSGPAADWLPPGVPVVEIKKRPGNDWSAIRRLATSLRLHQIEIVQSHNWGTLVETVVARKLARVPVHIHAERGTVLGSVDGEGWKQRFRAITMRSVLRTVNLVISNAHSVAERVESRCGYPSQTITIVPNGVPPICIENQPEVRQKNRTSLGIDSDSVLIGSVGRLHPVKGYDVLIHAMQKVSQHTPAHLVIVGAGEERGRLQEIIGETMAKDRIHLVGHQENVGAWLSAMDVYVNSSHSEGMSQSLVEAMSVGLPIVATDVGDAKRMIRRDGLECGEVCPPNNPGLLANSIQNVLGVREKYGRTAEECHRRFYSESNFHESIQAIYRQNWQFVVSRYQRSDPGLSTKGIK